MVDNREWQTIGNDRQWAMAIYNDKQWAMILLVMTMGNNRQWAMTDNGQ